MKKEDVYGGSGEARTLEVCARRLGATVEVSK